MSRWIVCGSKRQPPPATSPTGEQPMFRSHVCPLTSAQARADASFPGAYEFRGSKKKHWPSICPMIMPRLRQVQQELADLSGFAQISYSVTPNVDTPEVMQKYARGLRIDQKTWHLLTGNRQEIYSLARESFGADTVVRSRQGADDFLHSEQAFLVDTEGFLRGIYNVGGAGDLERLVEDIRKLTQE